MTTKMMNIIYNDNDYEDAANNNIKDNILINKIPNIFNGNSNE